MLFYMVRRRIDIAAAERASEFLYSPHPLPTFAAPRPMGRQSLTPLCVPVMFGRLPAVLSELGHRNSNLGQMRLAFICRLQRVLDDSLNDASDARFASAKFDTL